MQAFHPADIPVPTTGQVAVARCEHRADDHDLHYCLCGFRYVPTWSEFAEFYQSALRYDDRLVIAYGAAEGRVDFDANRTWLPPEQCDGAYAVTDDWLRAERFRILALSAPTFTLVTALRHRFRVPVRLGGFRHAGYGAAAAAAAVYV